MRRTLALLALLAVAAVPTTASADHDTFAGIECSATGVWFQSQAGAPWTIPVGVVWVLSSTSANSWTMDCQLWLGERSGAPDATFHDTATGPAYAFATVATVSGPSADRLVWCMQLSWTYSDGHPSGSYSRCYYQQG